METIAENIGSSVGVELNPYVVVLLLYVLGILIVAYSIVRSRKPRKVSEIPKGSAMLTFSHNPTNIERVHLVKDVVFFGRDDDNDIVLPSSAVSRRHCMIRGNGVVFTISDLESMNGILVNGRKVRHTRLYHGDVICINGFVMTFWCRNTYDEGIAKHFERSDV